MLINITAIVIITGDILIHVQGYFNSYIPIIKMLASDNF